MARRNEHTLEEIKEMVLNAAETIIFEEGVEALTARKIAIEIGYTVGSIYMVFTNMQDLLMHIRARSIQKMALYIYDLSNTNSTEQQLHEMAKRYLDFAKKNFHIWRIIFEPMANDFQSVPEWYQQQIDSLFLPVETLCHQINTKQSQAQIHLAARTLWCGIHGVCLLTLNGSLGRSGVENAASALNMLVSHFIQGLKA
jgi:AcrR family transcriptional regulator